MGRGLSGRRVLLGVTGSIAAYKGAELGRLLVKAGAHVQVAMTEASTRFVGPVTFHAITARPPLVELFALGASAEKAFADGRRSDIEHVEQAHGADLVIVAPATATSIARFSHGFADDVVAAIVLATRAPVLVAPAMEPGMWENAATRENVARLTARGVRFIGPAEGALASGRSGVGRMSEPEEIARAAELLLAPRDLMGRRLVITAGPTWEAIDPVRVLSNRSTGAIGIELARAAAARGAEVSLVLGPTTLAAPSAPSLRVVHVESALEMLEMTRAAAEGASVLIASAAVSDFRPADARGAKLKRGDPGARTLALTENPDVLATVAAEMRARGPAVIIGFAAETEDAEQNARAKLARKGCDVVIANIVGRDAGFGAGASQVVAYFERGAPVAFGPAPKAEIAQFVLDQVRRVEEQQRSG